jgi:hypothetical protein
MAAGAYCFRTWVKLTPRPNAVNEDYNKVKILRTNLYGTLALLFLASAQAQVLATERAANGLPPDKPPLPTRLVEA